MKRIIFFTVFTLIIAGGYNIIHAQSPHFSIFDSFEAPSKTGEGVVIINQSEAVRRLVGTRIDNENVVAQNGKTFLRLQGYRIHVYSGNNPRKSKEEAAEFQTKIKELFHGIDTYVRYYAPFWKLHIGNFLTFEEAWLSCRELHKSFPQIKNEIYIIEDEIRLPLD